MFLLYNILLTLYFLFMTPSAMKRNSKDPGYLKRLLWDSGSISEELMKKLEGKDPIWVHAASVGEIVAATPVVKALSDKHPERPIVVSIVTSTGYAMAKKMIPNATEIIYFPMDFYFSVKRIMTQLHPSIIIIVETEIWPNLIYCAKQAKIPMALINGRISDKSFKRYAKARWFFKRILPYLSLFSMQSSLDAKRIIKMGAPQDKVVVLGNTKYDEPFPFVSEEERKFLIKSFKLEGAYPIIIGGSTHEGEEGELFSAFKKVKSMYEKAALILVPRRPYRAKVLLEEAKSMGYVSRLRSEQESWGDSNENTDVLLVDTIGELIRLYSLGHIVFVGGSLVPIGGHNVLEPAFFGKSIVVGPYMNNFKGIYKMLKDEDAIYTVNESDELGNNQENLEELFIDLAANPDKAEAMGRRAVDVIVNNQGAAHKCVAVIDELLCEKGTSHE